MNTLLEPTTSPQAVDNTAHQTPATVIDVSRPAVLTVRGLRKAFGGQIVLDGVDLELREGEVILLRGDNGSGKTTLINILTGNLEPDAGIVHYLADRTPREFHFPRRWWQDLNPFDHFTPESTAREGIGRMWQDVRLFRSQTLRNNIAVAAPANVGENPIRALFSPRRVRQSEIQTRQTADGLLARLGLAGRETSSADRISLGQSKRVAIARAVGAGAKILFLDEPLAGLDRQGIRDVLALLASLAQDQRVTLVLVEHVLNHSHLHGLVTSDWVLAQGKLTRGHTRSALRGLSPAVPPRLAWLKYLGNDAEIVDEPLPRGALLTRIRLPHRLPSASGHLLKVCGLVANRGSYTVVGINGDDQPVGLDLSICKGEIVVLQAPNGWGKSTLFEVLAGLLPAQKGNITIAGRNIDPLRVWERATQAVSLFSASLESIKNLSVAEFLRLRGIAPDLALPFSYSRQLSSLSGGQLRRVLLSSFLGANRAPVALLDEPFNALDEEGVAQFAAALSRSNAQVIFIAEPIRL